MAIKEIERIRVMGDLVLNEKEPTVGLTRQNINVNVPTKNKVRLGSIAYRAITAESAPAYTILTAVDADKLVDTNQFAVVIGDHYAQDDGFELRPVEAGKFNAVAIVRGSIQLKDYYIKKDLEGFTDANFDTLFGLLAKQGILVAPTL